MNLRRVSLKMGQPTTFSGHDPATDPSGQFKTIGEYDKTRSRAPQSVMRSLCAKGVGAIVAEMKSHEEDASVCYWGCWNVAKLMARSEEDSLAVVQEGGVELLREILTRHTSAKVIAQALLVLGSASAYTDNRRAIVNGKVVELAVKKVRQFGEDPAVALYGCQFMREMGRDMTRRAYLLECRALEEVVFAMQRFAGDADVLYQGTRALISLSLRDRDATRKLVQLGIRDIIEDAQYEFSGDYELTGQLDELEKTLPVVEGPTAEELLSGAAAMPVKKRKSKK